MVKLISSIVGRQKSIWLLVAGTCLLVGLFGCAAIKEGMESVAGVSTAVLEKGRKTAVTKTINYDYFTCYTKTLQALTELKAYVYAKDIKKGMIAIYVSEEDTTPIGFFFKEKDQNNTQIEVASPSSYAKEYFAAKLFPLLEKPANAEKTGSQQ